MSPTPHDAIAEQEIRDAMARWGRSLERRDLDAMMADYAPDAVLFDAMPPYRTDGAAAIRKVWAESLPHFPTEFKSIHRNVTIHVSGDVGFAFGLHAIHSDTEPKHPACQSWIRFTIGYRRIDGRWLSVHDHVSFPIDMATQKFAPITDID